MSSSYPDRNNPNGSINEIKLAILCCQHLFSKETIFAHLALLLLMYFPAYNRSSLRTEHSAHSSCQTTLCHAMHYHANFSFMDMISKETIDSWLWKA